MNSIKYLRIMNGYTQEELAKKLGITQKSISLYERNLNYPSTKNLIKLSKVFGITIDELISKYTPETTTRSDELTKNNNGHD